jgi:hypothetical protein
MEYSAVQRLFLIDLEALKYFRQERIYFVGSCSPRPSILFRCITICGLKGAHWEIETDWHIEAVFVWR